MTDKDPAPGGVSGDLAVIGEGTQSRQQVSLQVLQGIYHEITGKSEELSKSFEEPVQLTVAEFEQLHHRIVQACEQYHVQAENLYIKIYYVDDTQDTFTSFERFRGFNAGSTSAVESVLFTYNFLVVPPKLRSPQSYSLSIRIASRITVEDQLRKGMFRIPKIVKMLGGRTAVVTIKYVDYAIARNLLNTVDAWFSVLPRYATPKWLSMFRKHSDSFPAIFRYVLGLLAVIFVYAALPDYVSIQANPQQLANFLFGGFLFLFGTYKIGHHIGGYAERAIDDWSEVSYVCLTEGDKRQKERALANNRKSVLKIIGSFVFSVATGAASKIVAAWLLTHT